MRNAFSEMNLFFNWTIIALQCCASFYCIASWIRYVYTEIPFLLSLLPTSPPSQPSRSPQSTELTPCAVQQLPAILHMVVYTCQCHTPNLSHLLSPASSVYKSVLYVCISIPALQIGLSVPEILYICVNIYLFFSFGLTSACTTDTMFFHITPNDSMSFLLVTNIPLYICTTCTHAKSLQSCLTLCDPMDCSWWGSSIHGILQATILEWVTMLSSRGSSQTRDWTRISSISCIGMWVLYH